jgi:hypothetical protein
MGVKLLRGAEPEVNDTVMNQSLSISRGLVASARTESPAPNAVARGKDTPNLHGISSLSRT